AGSRSICFGTQQIRSLPDAVARALELHIESLEKQETEEQSTPSESANSQDTEHSYENGSHSDGPTSSPLSLSHLSVTGNLCPQCGCNTMVYERAAASAI